MPPCLRLRRDCTLIGFVRIQFRGLTGPSQGSSMGYVPLVNLPLWGHFLLASAVGGGCFHSSSASSIHPSCGLSVFCYYNAAAIIIRLSPPIL